MVRRRAVPINRVLPPIKIYLDEVERVVEILRTRTNAVVYIAAGDVEVDEVEELRTLGKRLNSLDIGAAGLWVNLGPATATIRAVDPTLGNRGIVAEIEDVLRPCRRRVFTPSKRRDSAGRESVTNYSTIMLERRAEHSTFLSRKKDDMLLLVIGAAVGAGIDRLVSWLS
jgi:hypothetical protein